MMLMLSDPNPPTNEAEPQAQAYVYPPPLVPGAGAKPPSPGGNAFHPGTPLDS